jgi:hypothetical protein
MDDIEKIKDELISHLKVELPYTFTKETHIKYLTLRDEDELFYRGGKFCCQKGNCIYLYNGGKRWKVPINFFDNDGNIIYTTTFFIKNSDEEITETNKDDKKKNEIIIAQQEVIKKLTQKIRELEYQLMLNDS